MSFISQINNVTSQVGKIIKDSFGPLAALDSVLNSAGSELRYPLEVGNSERYPHTVQFQTWIPRQVPISDMGVVQAGQNTLTDSTNSLFSGLNKLSKKVNEIAGTNLSQIKTLDSYVDTYAADMMKVDRNQQFNDRLLDFTRRADRSDLITMYMPAMALGDRISNAYNQTSITNALGGMGLALDVGSAISKTNVSTGDMINGPGGIEGISNLVGSLGMDGNVVRDAGLNAIGWALNPQFEMLYTGTDLREFQFEFNFTPRSKKEALMIQQIIRRFKYHASPAFVAGQGRYIVPPSYFDITFKFNGADSDWLPQISTCVLKSFDIDYSGGLDTWSTHEDGSPIQIKMQLVFAELEMMHKTLRNEGY